MSPKKEPNGVPVHR